MLSLEERKDPALESISKSLEKIVTEGLQLHAKEQEKPKEPEETIQTSIGEAIGYAFT